MNSGWLIGGAALAVAAAYRCACQLTGEELAQAWWDERELARQELPELAARFAGNPRVADIVATLTSIPSRLHLLPFTLKSLLRQTVRPREIRLCLPEWSAREQCAYAIPPWLAELTAVTVTRCPDEGPATKFLTTLGSVGPDQAVWVVDDDRVYHPRYLERMESLARSHPGEILAGAGWSVPADRVDRPTTLRARWRQEPYVPLRANQVTTARRVDVVQGVHGYLVRPRFFDLEALGDFTPAPPAVRYVDDVWISAHAKAPRVVRPMALPFTDYKPWRTWRAVDRSSLGRNVNRSARAEDRGNSIALRYFEGKGWLECGSGKGTG